jgi:Cu2+-exporting ATPase
MLIVATLACAGFAAAAWRELQAHQKKQTSVTQQQSALRENTSETITPNEKTHEEHEIIHYHRISLVTLAIAATSTLLYRPLILCSLPFLTYSYTHYLKRNYQVFKKKQWALGAFELTTTSLTLFSGNYLACAFIYTMFFTARRLVIKTERQAHTDFSALFHELPRQVWLLCNGVERQVRLNTIQPGDTIIIRPGETIAADGIILSGAGIVDQQSLTGESAPAEKKPEDTVFASTVLLSGELQVTVTQHGNNSVTGRIVQTLQNTDNFKQEIESRGEKMVQQGANITLLTAISALPVIGLSHALALTYAGFGYQLRITAPLNVLNYLRLAARHGILIKDGRTLDTLQQIDTFVFDKTGTLTETTPKVSAILSCSDLDEAVLLQYALTAEQHQEHPIAQAIRQHTDTEGICTLPLLNSHYEVGNGIRFSLQDPERGQQTALLGSLNFMRNTGVALPDNLHTWQTQQASQGHTVIFIARDETKALLGAIALRPRIRQGAQQLVHTLQSQGKSVYILSGDQKEPTQHLANQLNIKRYIAEVLPEGKADMIQQLKNKHKKVCFIGDGINDAVALQTADVSISFQGASAIATDVADIVLTQPELAHILVLSSISSDLHQNMNISEKVNLLSGIACVSGVLLLNMSLNGAIILYYSTLFANILRAMMPLLSQPKMLKKSTL